MPQRMLTHEQIVDDIEAAFVAEYTPLVPSGGRLLVSVSRLIKLGDYWKELVLRGTSHYDGCTRTRIDLYDKLQVVEFDLDIEIKDSTGWPILSIIRNRDHRLRAVVKVGEEDLLVLLYVNRECCKGARFSSVQPKKREVFATAYANIATNVSLLRKALSYRWLSVEERQLLRTHRSMLLTIKKLSRRIDTICIAQQILASFQHYFTSMMKALFEEKEQFPLSDLTKQSR